MPIIVAELKPTDTYAKIPNYHLRDKNLSLKAKGLLTMMLNFPNNWEITIEGLISCSSDGNTSVSAAVKELESHGYLIRTQQRTGKGKIGKMLYTVIPNPNEDNPSADNPQDDSTNMDICSVQDNNKPPRNELENTQSAQDRPHDFRQWNTRENSEKTPDTAENPLIENTLPDSPLPHSTDNKLNNNKLYINKLYNNQSLCHSLDYDRESENPTGKEDGQNDFSIAQVREQIGFEVLTQAHDADLVSDVTELVYDILNFQQDAVTVAGMSVPASRVKAQFQKLDYPMVNETLCKLRQVAPEVKNVRQYLFACLYNKAASSGAETVLDFQNTFCD